MTHARTPHEINSLLAEAWNTGDAAVYGALFTEDADYVTFLGHRLRGRGEIEKAHAPLFDGPLRGSRLTHASDDNKPSNVRVIADGVAVIVSAGAIQVAGQEGDPSRDSVTTAVAVEEGGRWLITAIQVTRVQQVPAHEENPR